MNSQQLADLLQQQAAAAPHEIRLNDQILGITGLDALVKADLARADGTLILIVNPATIPADPPATGFTLSANVPGGTDGFLSLDARDCSIQFLIGNTIDLILTINTRLSDGTAVPWVFSTSFPQLANQPYDSLTLANPQLIFSTGGSGTPPAGLNFNGLLALDGLFATIANLIGVADQYALTGAIAYNSIGFNFDLQANLNIPSQTLAGIITLQNLFAGVALTPMQSDGEAGELTSLYLGATVVFANTNGDELPLGVQAQMPLNSSSGQILILSVRPQVLTVPVNQASRAAAVTTITTAQPHNLKPNNYATVAGLTDTSFNGVYTVVSTPSSTTFTYAQSNLPDATSSGGTAATGLDTSLDSLGSLIGGQTWDSFFSGPGSVLEPYFSTFGLLGYSTTFTLSPSISITAISLSVGTLSPWTLWDDYTLTLRGDWNILFAGSQTISTLKLTADFNFGTINFLVTVTLPNLVITGRQSGGALTYSLADLNDALFEGALVIPPDLLTISVADFGIDIDTNSKRFSIGATASASFSLFGLPLLAIHNMAIGVQVDASGPKNIYSASLNGGVSVGTLMANISATLSTDSKADCVFSMHLVNETIGTLINQLIHLIDPNFTVNFGAPWNTLLDISLDALVLKVTLPGKDSKTPQSVSLTYDADIDLGFMQIKTLGLKYAKSATGPGNTTIELSGTFLGVQFGTGQSGQNGQSNPPLGWDVMNGTPPAVPGQGDSLFELQYAGLGQHITFDGVDLPNMAAVMKALRESVIPAQPGQLPPFGQNSLAFSAESNWLVGAQFSIMNTIAISAIFNDPNMYGVLIAMYGEKAKIFAGLSFEILYRKINDSIGVYHIELKLPDAMRYLQFGEVSITLPIVVLDIYTNGNFKIDLGFPVGNDFSRSFALQIFPFVGYGGLYFALLDGATSTRVPQITNGTFSPVIEFGLALSIGVGKTVNWSVISGGLTITVQGILQGVLGWFQPYEPADHALYYWLQGSVAIVGKLYANINFGIIKANIDLTAYASVTLTVQCYSPILIELSVGVSIRISVKVVFFTIHLSFSATIKASFTIGNSSQPPWQLASGQQSTGRTVTINKKTAQPQLRGQDTLYAPHSMHAGYSRALRMATLTASAAATNWPAICVFPQGKQTVGLWALPAFTKSETTAGVTDAVMLLAAGNSINPGAASLNDQQKLAGAEPASAAFNLLMQAMLAWGIHAETGGGTSVTADQLVDLQQQLKDEDVIEAAFNYQTLTDFLAANFTFDIATVSEWAIAATGAVRASGVTTIATTTAHGFVAGNVVTISGVTDTSFDGQYTVASVPSATTFTYAQDGAADASSGNGAADVTVGVALFPMIPAIKLTDTAGTSVDFSSFNGVDENYEEKITAYFELLQVQFQQQQQQGGAQPKAQAAALTASMAKVIFSYYFNMLMSSGVQAAIDLLANYPYTTTAASSIEDVANAIGDTTLVSEPLRVVTSTQDDAVLNAGAVLDLPSVVYQIRANDTFDSIAEAFQTEGASNSGGQAYSTSDLFAANLDTTGIFNTGVGVQYSGLQYTTQANDTLNLISVRLMLRAAGPATVNSIANLGQSVQSLQAVNPAITNPNAPLDAGTTVTLTNGGSYLTVAGDTLTLVAAYFLAIEQSTFDLNTFLNSLLAIPANQAFVGVDPNQALTVGAAMAMPPVTYAFQSTDTINTVATTLIGTAAIIETNLLNAPASPAVLAPQGVLSVPLFYKIQANDTFSGIAAKFDLTLQTVADQAVVIPQNGQMPKVFAANQALTITDLASIGVQTLMENLLNEAEWNNASGMVSRFMLSGLRLPDPNDTYFQNLTVQDLLDPAKLGAIKTLPMYELTGQQYQLGATVPASYQITLTNNAGAPWLSFAGQTSATFALTADQQQMAADIASTALQTNVQTLTRLSLFQMVPPRLVLQNHIAWQAAVPPAGCLSSATGNPAIWLFPDSLVEQVEALTAPALYETVVAKHTGPDQPVSADQASCYAWATIVDFNVSLPVTDDNATSIANAYVIEGADDTGAALLQQVYQYLATQTGNQATLYLLYSPNPAGTNPSGLASDELNDATTYILKTNLSTLTHSGNTTLKALAAADPTAVYDATLSDAAGFIALLWEASITRSGGFYLNYVNQNGGAALPPSVFGSSSTATLSLLVVLNEQANNRDAAIQPFNNCVIVAGNVDTSTSSLFVQPATYTVVEGDSLTTATNNFNAAWGTSFTLLQTATFNQSVQLLLQVGAQMTVPGQSNPYEIGYGDTLASIVAKFNVSSLNALITAGSNATAPILAAGSPMQFADNVLQPATTVPPGTVGFEMTRTNPDPNNLPYDQLTPAQVVGSLFNLVGFNIAGAGGFIESGAGLPTTPADSWQDQTDGLEQRDLDDSTDPNWYYHQTLAVYPFATVQNGSASPALPPVASNPYNGVGFNAAANQINEVTLNLDVQDIYGNIQPLPSQFASLQVPVGYYDDIANLGSWPSLAISYLVTGAANAPAITFQMTMQQSRYVPAPGVAVTSALSSAQADLVSYQNIYYQLSQPDLSFCLQTSLDTASMASLQSAYPLQKTPFYSFAYGAFVYLAAMATMQAVEVTSDGTTNVETLTAQYGVTAAQLFTANQDTLYSALFGAETLVVPLMYSTVAGDSLSSVATKFGLTADALATTNETAPLAPGVDLTTPERSLSVSGSATQSLNSIAQSVQASAAGIAEANADLTDILQAGVTLSVGTQLYRVSAGDSFNSVAAALGSTVADVAGANQYLQGLFVEGAALGVTDAVAGSGDTLATMAAKFADGDVNTLATANADLPDLFAAGTQLQVGINSQAKPPQPTDSLSSFATNNTITVAQLAAANAGSGTVFAAGANVSIPGVVTNTSPQQFCTYTASALDTLGGIAAKFNQPAATIAALNPDIPGLFVAGQTITTGGKSVTTEAGDTFNSILSRFGQQGVTLTLSQLAAAIAAQSGLLAADGLWICPPMLGGANGQNSAGTLDGLAAAYNIQDVATLATANAASIGLLASGVQLNQWSVGITTNQFETLNSLVNRLAEAGINATVEDVAATVASQPNLIQPQAMVVPVPPPSPLGNQAAIHPKFASSVFQIAVNVVTTRNPQWIDPDFANVAAVGTSVYSVAPEPDPQGEGNSSPYSLTQFAADLQTALPGLQAATGDPVAVDDPASASTIWAVNFGNNSGPQINYQFQGANTQYFALPPLSTSLMGGAVDIVPYVSGQTPPFTAAPTTQTFQAVDLDVWLNTFLQTVDLFLSPAYAVPAYALDPTDTVNIVEQKQTLAQMLSARLQYVLQGEQAGSIEDARGAMYQALLTELSSAFTIDTVVQVPITVTTTGEQPAAPPNLSGKMVMNDPGGSTPDQSLPSTFSFSTAKATLTAPGSTATFLFNVKSPASHKDANLNLQYAVTELELPDPNSTIGDYEGSSWLQFILPLNGANPNTDSNIGNVNIPIPLRSYPSPVTLAAQTARQSVAEPAAVTDLLGWNFGFVYQHDDAEQDSPMAAVTFNATGDTVQGLGRANNNANLTNIYNALAQFMAAYPALKNDLALLAQVAPGTANPTAESAVAALSWLVNNVTSAWQRTAMAAMFIPETETYCYQMEKGLTDGATPALETLTLNSVDIDTGEAKTTTLWPSVVALYEGNTYPLPVTGLGQQTQATYSYPTGNDAIPAATQLQQCFLFGPAIAAGGASRAGGVTTVTTTVPHGLSVGDQVIVSGVTDASFNGIFTVSAAPSATAFSYAQSAAPNANSGNGTASKLIAWGASQSIAPSGASRAGGVTTVTTLAPHGLSAGDQVIISGVADASFNGLFTVVSASSATGFTYAQTGLPNATSGGGTAGGLLPAATTTLNAPQLFSFNEANILSWQNALAGVAITRNQSLIEGVPTNPAFVYQTPISNFTSLAIPSVFAESNISIGSGAVSGLAAALGGFLETLLTARNQWTAGQLLSVRLSAAYSYALAASAAGSSSLTELGALVPILLVPSCDFDPTSDWNAANTTSFVSQVQAVIADWQRLNQPVTAGGSFVFNLTIYAAQGQMQPLIQATSLQYDLS